jgi:hypothetical protein
LPVLTAPCWGHLQADVRASSYGLRPQRSAAQTLETLRVRGTRGGNHVLGADPRDYFGSINLRAGKSYRLRQRARRCCISPSM